MSFLEEVSMNTDDRRIRKTKKALREALAELMMKKELIQVSQLLPLLIGVLWAKIRIFLPRLLT